jgi:hypothetical protein
VKFSSSILAVAVIAACSGSNTGPIAAAGDRNSTVDTVQVNGPLRLEVHDMMAAAAITPFPAASITGATGAIVANNSQFGSLCQYAVSGDTDVRGATVGLHVVLAPRLTICTADLRVLQYTMTLTIAPGTYDVAFVRELNGAADTLARRTVTVR